MENGGAYKLIQEARAHKEEALNFDYRNIPETEIACENMLETCPMLIRYLISAIEEFNPEYLPDDLPFYYENGEILLNSSKLIKQYKYDTNDNSFLTPRKVGRMLKELTGKDSIDKRVHTLGHPVDGQIMKCFVFSCVEELKSNITQHYFGGLNPFV